MASIVPKSAKRIRLARSIAVSADIVQILLFPWVFQGVASPVDDILDVAVAILLTLLVGWHIAFIPSFIVKLIPVADLAPTWTVATFLATRNPKPKSRPDDLPALGLKDSDI
jgi:hypothetical protein